MNFVSSALRAGHLLLVGIMICAAAAACGYAGASFRVQEFCLAERAASQQWTTLFVHRSPTEERPAGPPGAKIRALPGGSVVLRPDGDFQRSALDIVPTRARPPDADALAELTVHRIAPSEKGYEMMSFCGLAQQEGPFGIIVETGGIGKPRPFVLWQIRGDESFSSTNSVCYEALRVQPDGRILIGSGKPRQDLLEIASGGVVLHSPNGARWRLEVKDDGSVSSQRMPDGQIELGASARAPKE